MSKRLLIIGGVAGGASCAARARRLSEEIEIIIFDRGPYVSFANCGLPYYVGNVIQDESKLLVASTELFKKRFNIEVRVESNVQLIDRDNKEIEIKDLKTGKLYREQYDALVLSPGASPIRPPLPGIDLPGIFALRTIPDSRLIRNWIDEKKVKSAVIIGGGFIGMEMTENLAERGIAVSIVEMQPQLMPTIDKEMLTQIHEYLTSKGVSLHLNNTVTGFEKTADSALSVQLKSGKSLSTDLVILCIGVRPESSLAKSAGLELGSFGGIRVNEYMQTSDPHIWAVGDAVEVKDYVTKNWTLIPLAGPANRQGRISAASIVQKLNGKKPTTSLPTFRGTQGTAVVKIFDMTIAATGTTEKNLKRLGITDYDKIYLHPGHHANYYPGAKPIDLKLIFSLKDGKILGAQAVGEKGIEKRIDVLAMAIQKNSTVFDLEEAELCYAPQFGAAKDPVNIAGMIASNVLRGDVVLTHWEDITQPDKLVLDVRDPAEYNLEHIAGAINIPLHELREQLDELPRDKEIWVHCRVGQRSYYASRLLKLNGFNVRNLSGGIMTYYNIKPYIVQ